MNGWAEAAGRVVVARFKPARHTACMAARMAPAVLLVSASMGAGHDGVANELARRLRAAGARVEVVDYLRLLPLGFGRLYRAVYAWQLRRLPSSYEWLYSVIDKPGPLDHLARFLCALGRRRLRRVVHRGGYPLVVSTYPMATQALGSLRRRRRLAARAVTFLTDADVHTLWLHPSIDTNLTVWPTSAEAAAARVDVPALAVGPVLPPEHRAPVSAAERGAARARLGLGEQKVALVVAGSWGVGDVLATARALHESGAAVPLVLCGRNEALRAALTDAGIGIAVGWTSNVRALLAAADVLVHNAGGLSCLEAYAAGVPVVGYACLPGHGRRNAVAMRTSRTAALAEDAAGLIDAVRRLAGTDEGARLAGRAAALFGADPTDRLLGMAAQPVPAQRRARAVVRLAAVAVALPATWGGLSFGVAQATSHGVGVATGRGAVYLAVHVDRRTAHDPGLAPLLRSAGASLALSGGRGEPTLAEARALAAAGVSIVGVDFGTRDPNPAGQNASLSRAAHAVQVVTGESRPGVAVLHRLTPLELTVAWKDDVRLARPALDLTAAHRLHRLPVLRDGDEVVLDERGRTMAQIAHDLQVLLRGAPPVIPMRRLWPAA